MDKIEKVKEGVKKQKKEELVRNGIGVITGQAFFVDADELLSFLDTLTEEPDKSLEEAAEDYVMDNIPDFNPESYDGSFFREEDMNHAFIAGAEWGAEHFRDSMKMIDKSLKEAAGDAINEYCPEGVSTTEGLVFTKSAMIGMFKDGAEWQASQMPMPEDTVLFNKGVAEGRRLEREDMMKDAFVVDYVTVDDGRIELEGEPLPCLNPIILLPYPQFQPGDRVRIILIKNESK